MAGRRSIYSRWPQRACTGILVDTMICYFLRHGQSQANADQVRAGQSDSPLTAQGSREAIDEGERLRREGLVFDVIISSPLVRAYETALAVADALGYARDAIVIDARLMERDFGELAGRPIGLHPEAMQSGAMGVESDHALRLRSQAVIDDVVRQYQGRTILLVSHNGVGKMMQSLLRNTSLVGSATDQRLPNAQSFQLLPVAIPF